jgi:hypothetical protein
MMVDEFDAEPLKQFTLIEHLLILSTLHLATSRVIFCFFPDGAGG